MLISFVFSFRNEEENIAELTRRVAQALGPLKDVRYEMIFVNDDSTDRSVAVLKSLMDRYPITVVNMSRCFGVTPCVLAGMAQAKGDAVVYMDSDLQDPPEIVPQMIEKFKNGAEVVHTTRTHRDGESALKMWVTKRAYRTINYFSDIPLPENTGDFKLLSRKVVQEILSLPESDPYMRGLPLWVGYRQDFVYYRRESRFGGATHFPLWSRGPAREFIRGLTAFSSAPLYLSFYCGMVTILFSMLLIVYAVITKFMGLATPGSAGVLITIAFFSGVILTTNGMMGLYIARIYNEVKRRPRYIVKSIETAEKPLNFPTAEPQSPKGLT